MKRVLGFAILMACGLFLSTDVAAQDDAWGVLKGKIVVDGEAPKNEPEAVGNNPDREACLIDGKIPLDDGVLVNEKNELADVFVMMYEGRGAKTPDKFHPSFDKSKAVKLTLDNQRCRFVPRSLFARPGQTLILKNSDAVGHNCHITTFKHEFNVNVPANKETEITLGEDSDKIPGDVKCDIHTWMDSVILIRDNPYVAISSKDGSFTIENLPPGDWKFQFWHKKIGFLKTIEIEGYEPDRKGIIEVSIKQGETLDLGTLKLPADAFAK